MHKRLLQMDRTLQGFGAAVMPVGEMAVTELLETLEPEVKEANTQELAGNGPNLIGAIAGITVDSPELRKIKAELLGEATTLQQKVDDLILKSQQERHRLLDDELEAVKAEARNQQKVAAQAGQEFLRCEQRLAEADNQKSAARLALVEHRDRGVRRYASRAEIRGHKRKDDELILACRKADEDRNTALSERNFAAEESNRQLAKLAEIDQRVQILEGQLSGKPFQHPEYGLMTGPQV